MTWRRWHRWLALPSALFLGFIAATGVLLHADMMRLGQEPPGHKPAPESATAPIPSNAELAAMTATIADAARAEPGLKVKVIQIEMNGDAITLSAGAGGPPGSPALKIDGKTGHRIIDPPPPADFHYVLQDWHAGYALGWTGRILSLLCGLALLILTITGLQMWWTMKQRGKKGWFWK